jgi:hypothetical protein
MAAQTPADRKEAPTVEELAEELVADLEGAVADVRAAIQMLAGDGTPDRD